MNQGARGYQETLLVDTIDRMRRNPEGRKLVILRIGQMQAQNRTPVRLKILTRMFRSLESGRQIQLFSLSNFDIAIIVNAGAQRDVNNIVHRIRSLYENDPVTALDPSGEDHFCTWFDLALDSAMALHAAQDLKRSAQTGQQRPEVPPLPPLSPALLDDLQKKLAYANVVPFVRDQPVLRVAGANSSIEFIEFFLSVGDLQRTTAPNVNILGDRWLFQDLSRTMDMRMLETVVRAPHAREAPNISLNLNMETVVTPTFKSFLARMGPKRIVVEVQAIDVLTNLNMYMEIQAALRAMGHAVLIDGLNVGSLRLLDVAQLKPDYAKVAFATELIDSKGRDSAEVVQTLAQNLGQTKVVLSRCESTTALSWGMKNGLSLFQGRFLDSLKGTGPRKAPPPAARPAG